MAKTVIIDTGPLVAVLSQRDHSHAWARSHFELLRFPCLTCEAVLSESVFLLEGSKRAQEALAKMLERGVIKTEFSFDVSRTEILHLLRRYRDTPLSFADACLVRMSELHADSTVFTTDADFNVYRRNGRQSIPLMAPF